MFLKYQSRQQTSTVQTKWRINSLCKSNAIFQAKAELLYPESYDISIYSDVVLKLKLKQI